MRRRSACAALVVVGLAVPLAAQFAVYDAAVHLEAIRQVVQLEQQLQQLVATYEQVRTQYLLLLRQAQKLPFSLEARYRSLGTPWRPLVAMSAYGTTASWIEAVNTGRDAIAAYGRATQPLASYAGAIGGLSADETARVETRYDRAQLGDGAIATGLEAMGRLRANEESVETTLQHLEADTYSDNPDFHTQIAVLNKINATGVTSARIAKDTHYLLVSLLEQQVLEATDRREAAVQGINAHVAFLTDARPLLARTTADTTTALTTFRIP
jgi:hypothetical protein